MSPASLEALNELMKAEMRRPGPMHRTVLLCGPDVLSALNRLLDQETAGRPWTPPGEFEYPSFAKGIQIIVAEDLPPLSYRLVVHDACQVDTWARMVTHGECTILAEGQIEPEEGQQA